MSEEQEQVKVSLSTRMLGTVERVGNKLPDPAVLFIYLLFLFFGHVTTLFFKVGSEPFLPKGL